MHLVANEGDFGPVNLTEIVERGDKFNDGGFIVRK